MYLLYNNIFLLYKKYITIVYIIFLEIIILNLGILTIQRGTLRPHVSSPTRIEHPNLPPLNLLPHKRSSKKGATIGQHASDTLLRSSITSSTYIPTI